MKNREIKLRELSLPTDMLKANKSILVKLRKIQELFKGEYNFNLHFDQEFMKKLGDLNFHMVLYSCGWFLFDDNFIFNVLVNHTFVDNEKNKFSRIKFLEDSLTVYVIPINKVEIVLKNNNMNGTYESSLKQGDVVKGAIAGGVIAGSTGAIIGAAATMKNENKVHSYCVEKYKIELYANFSRPYEFELFEYNYGSKKIEPTKNFYFNEAISHKYYNRSADLNEVISDYQAIIERMQFTSEQVRKKEECLDLIYKIYGKKSNLNIYVLESDFVNSLVDLLTSINDEELDVTIKYLRNIQNKMLEITDNKEILKKQITNENKQLECLSFWQVSKRNHIKDRIEKLRKKLNEQDDSLAYIDTIIDNLKNTSGYLKLYNRQKEIENQYKMEQANTEDYIKCQMKKCINLYFSQNSDYIIRLKNIKNKIDSFFDDDLQKKAEWYEILKTFEFLLKNDNGSSIDNMRFKDKYFQNMSRDKIKSILQVLLKLDVVEEFLNVYEIKK